MEDGERRGIRVVRRGRVGGMRRYDFVSFEEALIRCRPQDIK